MADYLADLLKSLDITDRPVDKKLIKSAWEFANVAHSGQSRLTGDPYISHPTAVAMTLAFWNMDTTTIVAGLLHDTIEDGLVTRENIVRQFGEEVARLVDGVTKITSIRLTGSTQEEFVENLRKMLLVMANDLRVIIVKLADRLHNLQTMWAIPVVDQVENATETLEIYAPLAERLGMGEIKGELEDLAFPYLNAAAAADLRQKIKPLIGAGAEYIKEFKRELLSLIRPEIPTAVINIRQKHLYSLYKKLGRPGIDGDLDKIHDLFAARIIVSTKSECYQALGLIHGKFRPVPYLGVSDFIATPKPNGYQSLHTKVFGPEGHIVELQIRTKGMHEQAEMGIAAHFAYTEGKDKGLSDQKLEEMGVIAPKAKLDWVRELVAWQQEIKDNNEYLTTLKIDTLQHRLLVFSPHGDVYDLPADSTPVDFAYTVHTDLGPQTAGAKVNGKLVQLDHRLQNGDVVEILLDRKRKIPNPHWLDFVVTNSARREISKHISAQT